MTPAQVGVTLRPAPGSIVERALRGYIPPPDPGLTDLPDPDLIVDLLRGCFNWGTRVEPVSLNNLCGPRRLQFRLYGGQRQIGF